MEPRSPTDSADPHVAHSADAQAKPPAGVALEHEGDPQVDQEVDPDDDRTVLIRLLPWSISLVLHAGLVALAIFVVWSTVYQASRPRIIPDIRLSDAPGTPLQVNAVNRRGLHSAVDRRTIDPSPQRQALTPLQTPLNLDTPLIGLTPSGDQATPFDAALQADTAFETRFFGTGGNARRIVFVVDATGSLIDTFDFVIEELKNTIRRLGPKQSFTLIFFSGKEVTGRGLVEFPPGGPRSATTERKSFALDWIDPSSHNIPRGGDANPIEALRQALQYHPDLIFLLSDEATGSGRSVIDQDRLLEQIAQANTARTKINTIQFIYPDPLEALGQMGTMERIAKQTGGRYKFVDAEELDLE